MLGNEVAKSFGPVDESAVSAHSRHHDDVAGPVQCLDDELTLQRAQFVIVGTDPAEDLWILAHDIHVDDRNAFGNRIIDLGNGGNVCARNDANHVHLVRNQVFHL